MANSGEGWALCLRLAFHDGAFGSRGCLAAFSDCTQRPCEFTSSQNRGLQGIITSIGKLYRDANIAARYHISSGDFWVLCEIVAVNQATSGALNVPFRYGRPECTGQHYFGDSLPHGSSPSGQAINDFFSKRMGFSVQDTTALFGAHSLGGMELKNSGFEGSWTARKTVLDNSFYKNLLNTSWRSRRNPAGNIQWTNGAQSMLPSDMGLVYNHDVNSICNGANPQQMSNCGLRTDDYGLWMQKYALDNSMWLRSFGVAFQKLQEFGNSGLRLPSR